MKTIVFIFLVFICKSYFAQSTYEEAVIETPEMQVLYEGIPIELRVAATGEYKEVRMSVPSPYTAPKGSAGSMITVSITGVDAEGNYVSLGSRKFFIKKLPKPELSWNGVTEGGYAIKSAGSLSCSFGNNVPFSPSKGMFSVVNYSITMDGIKGSLCGSGSVISAQHLKILRDFKGANINIQVRYTGTGEGLVSAIFKN
jgi:hypothetical protein